MSANAQVKRRLRGEVLKLVYENHEAQRTRLDDVTLTGVLERLGFDVFVNLVREILQDLGERELVKFEEEKNRVTGKISIRKIQILPKGRDVIEKTISDLAVDVE
jgi:transcription initiation factor IIE alpha subunit